ncbi:hypothetical protein DYBT9275_05949 [Dyadobacter sp. CECT 9275]|uniref:Uncharacterized protein n=1 Tax=Dyadobacter helix TaxID=2822344 RepID=A0A916NE91_9BACT|nr:hypothetical protein DYBT9275_05949 [Dyadobacter sp. CECT 9275]
MILATFRLLKQIALSTMSVKPVQAFYFIKTEPVGVTSAWENDAWYFAW